MSVGLLCAFCIFYLQAELIGIPPQDCMAPYFARLCLHLLSPCGLAVPSKYLLQPDSLGFTGRFQLNIIICFWIGKEILFCPCGTKLSFDSHNAPYAGTGTWNQVVNRRQCAFSFTEITRGISFYCDYWWIKLMAWHTALTWHEAPKRDTACLT